MNIPHIETTKVITTGDSNEAFSLLDKLVTEGFTHIGTEMTPDITGISATGHRIVVTLNKLEPIHRTKERRGDKQAAKES
jgi:hypothetical protein